MDIGKLCEWCMEMTLEGNKCKNCGYVRSKEKSISIVLPAKTILNGQYVIGRELGHGGFGITYLGYDMNLNIKVAIKEYLPDGLATRAVGQVEVTSFTGEKQSNYAYGLVKFFDEARTLAQFGGNPRIVTVKNIFKENSTAYFIMEYLSGQTLKQYIQSKGGRLNWEESLKIGREILLALRDIHEKGYLHRDISPDNIYVTEENRIVLLDFGAARQALGEKSQCLSVILKEGYAPLEQYSSHGKQGPWTDLYASAATIYYMLAGTVPPHSTDRIHEDSLDFTGPLWKKVPEEIIGLLSKALAVKITDRYTDINLFIQDIQACLEKSSGKAMAAKGNVKKSNASGKETDVTVYDSEVTVREYDIDSSNWHKIKPDGKTRRQRKTILIAGLAGVLMIVSSIAAYFYFFNKPQQTAGMAPRFQNIVPAQSTAAASPNGSQSNTSESKRIPEASDRPRLESNVPKETALPEKSAGTAVSETPEPKSGSSVSEALPSDAQGRSSDVQPSATEPARTTTAPTVAPTAAPTSAPASAPPIQETMATLTGAWLNLHTDTDISSGKASYTVMHIRITSSNGLNVIASIDNVKISGYVKDSVHKLTLNLQGKGLKKKDCEGFKVRIGTSEVKTLQLLPTKPIIILPGRKLPNDPQDIQPTPAQPTSIQFDADVFLNYSDNTSSEKMKTNITIERADSSNDIEF